MAINNEERFFEALPAGFDGIFDWDFLKGAFGNVIMPMDLDGVVERYGNILIFETKAPGVEIKRGQVITLEAFLNLRPGAVTVFIVYGKTQNNISSMEIWRSKSKLPIDPANAQTVFNEASKWYQNAERNPKRIVEDTSLLKRQIDKLRNQLSEKEKQILDMDSVIKSQKRIEILMNNILELLNGSKMDPRQTRIGKSRR